MCQGIITHRNGIDTKTVSGMLGIFSEGFTPDSYAHVTTATQKGTDDRKYADCVFNAYYIEIQIAPQAMTVCGAIV